MLDAFDFVNTAFGKAIAVIEDDSISNCINIARNAVNETVNIRRSDRFCSFESLLKIINMVGSNNRSEIADEIVNCQQLGMYGNYFVKLFL